MKNQKNIKYSYSIGEEWLYYKIYCGEKTADTILVKCIISLSQKLVDDKVIDKWFFIRYKDPDFHLRVRFHLKDLKYISLVIELMKNGLANYITSKEVWKVQLDTYTREIERYGDATIQEAENLFFIDSSYVLNLISTAKNNEDRFVNIFYWVEHIIEIFKLENMEKIVFLQNMLDFYKDEYDANKQTTKALLKKYNALKPLLSVMPNDSNTVKHLELTTKIEKILQKLDKNTMLISKTSLLSSLIHMSINRTFRTNQRLYEMMVYDFLLKKVFTKTKQKC